ncbi:MAG: response regulator transcription factor [Acidimicrobiia bacterium]|nr:response regulator transcription factor [Acidimicrobiia bacterium]
MAERILIVDDERSVVDGVRRGLTDEGFEVDEALDGAEGLEKARSGGYDLIILDIMLPTLNGYRVCAELRESGDLTPILMLTAKDGEYDEAEGLETGADDYLTKPFSFVVLMARIRALLRRPRGDQPTAYRVGDLRLDPVRHRCWRGDVEVGLTAREVEVLARLLVASGEVVPKTELIEAVWGADFDGDPNIVEVYIRHLRRKVDEPFDAQTIETVRGVGYRLVARAGAVS